MIYYSKYSDNDFTLDNADYSGFFHIYNNNAWTGKIQDRDSLELTPKVTFMCDLFLNSFETDTTYKNISSISPYYSNVFDILNKQGLETALGVIDQNNLICFKDLVLGHPTIYQVEKNSGFFYGLSSVNSDNLTGKTSRISIDPFSSDSVWSFMDDIQSGTFVIDSDENFKYICSTGPKNYILGGSFVDKKPLRILQVLDQHPDLTTLPLDYRTDYTHHIHNDIDNDKIIMVNNDWIDIYDSSNYESCNNPLSSNLIDRISLEQTTTTDYIWNRINIKWSDLKVKWSTRFTTKNINNPQFIKFGGNLRTSISNNILYLLNKYSSDVYQTIDLTPYGVVDVITLDIRAYDDNIIILHRKDGDLYVLLINWQDLSNTFSKKLKSIRTDLESYHIKFSNFDSNIFNIYNKYEYQGRYLSAPQYPYGRLEDADLFYPVRYKWGEIAQYWKYSKFKWAYSSKESNLYNNLASSELVKNGKMYILHHNVGRLYTIRQPLRDRLFSALPIDLEKTYRGVECSESSLGLYFNTSISNIVRDILNIFNQSSSSFSIGERIVIQKQLNDFVLETENLYINGNETISIVTLQRIFVLITQIQSKLIPTSIEV